jgi:hypothetical protein
MVEREKIRHGARLRLLRQRDGVASDTGACRKRTGRQRGAFAYWEDYKKKNRYSLFSLKLIWNTLSLSQGRLIPR